MIDSEQTVEILRQQGYRLTPQRLLVLSIVNDSNGHLGVNEVFRRAKESYPYLDIATVYRTLNLFKRLGVVTEVAIAGGKHRRCALTADQGDRADARRHGARLPAPPPAVRWVWQDYGPRRGDSARLLFVFRRKNVL